MQWQTSHRFDKRALPLANRHYSRQKPESPQFVKPGACVVMLSLDRTALWVSSFPKPEYCDHQWKGAWECAMFRNEGKELSSRLIKDAVAVTDDAYRRSVFII
jgi:hypothetical protein